MIKTLKIERFKSIRRIDLVCRRVNLFIGEPNTGKSNILEALGLVSWSGGMGPQFQLREFVRFHLTQNLFYDSLTDEPIYIEWNGGPSGKIMVKFFRDNFSFSSDNPGVQIAQLDYSGQTQQRQTLDNARQVKFYRFKLLEKFDSNDPGGLLAPHGVNLFSVVYASKAMRDWFVELLRPYGLAVVMKPQDRAFELQKNQNGVVTAYPYSMISDTLQRALFYHAAMASNKNSILVFEEPEAHAFPYYTKHLGERIALDPSNQYFIATHNPYLLTAVLEKAKKEDIAVFGTRYRNFETEVKLLGESQIGKLLDADPFLGLEDLLEEG